MPTSACVLCIAIGVALIGGSRTIAESFKIAGSTSPLTTFLGLGDSHRSRLYRWAVAMVTGLAFLSVGIAALVS